MSDKCHCDLCGREGSTMPDLMDRAYCPGCGRRVRRHTMRRCRCGWMPEAPVPPIGEILEMGIYACDSVDLAAFARRVRDAVVSKTERSQDAHE